ncbi:MAG: MlrC C-terminal domain-containing protein, partial [Planctomycetales bacterium]|nr:MlrC C-terminal domain-containing protein [Planctomycetales bacterium]
ALAEQLAAELANEMWRQRESYRGDLTDIDHALAAASELAGTVCLLDMGDNVGGGSPGDGTLLLHASRARAPRKNVLCCLHDPQTVSDAIRTGVGGRCLLNVGGKADAKHGAPFVDEFTVLSLHDGKFSEPLPRHGGASQFDQGPCAVIRNDSGVTILVNSLRTPPFSLRQLTSCGVTPQDFEIVIAKGVNAPIAAYREACRHFIRVNTPGCTTADMTTLDFVHRRRPLFPFEVTGKFG